MNWAMRQKTDGPSAQIVLYIIADTANENGVSVHADPDYIAQRSRQSRATVFRRLNELEREGALTRFKKYRADGAPIYEVRLALDRDVDYAAVHDDGAPEQVESENEIPKSQSETLTGETGGVSPVRQAKSQSCDRIENPSKSPDSPQSPSLSDHAEPPTGTIPYERFTEVYGEGSSRPERARALWAAFSDPERDVRIRAARAYRTQRVAGGKLLMDPEKFLRNPDLATEFASKPTADAASIVLARIEDPAGQAWGVLHAIAGAVPRRTSAGGREVFVLPCEASEQLLALARFANQYGRPSDDRTWWDVTGQAAGAWREFVAKAIGKPIRAGPIMRVPRPFPPRIDGTWSDQDQNNQLQKAG